MGVFFWVRRIAGFAKQDRLGVLWITLALGFVLVAPDLVKPEHSPSVLELNSQEVVEVQRYLDSLKEAATSFKWKPYTFNPNYITDYNAYVWGMSSEELERLHTFRKTNSWVNSAAEFQKVTQISDSLLSAMRPYFKFPAWVTQRTNNSKKQSSYPTIKAKINTASIEDLQVVRGIGPVLAQRIINFKERYGSYSDTLQLQFIYGLSNAVRKELWMHFEIQNPEPIQKLNFNTSSASDLATIPGVTFDLAREMVFFRRLHEHILDPQELLKIDGVTAQNLAGILLYLQFE